MKGVATMGETINRIKEIEDELSEIMTLMVARAATGKMFPNAQWEQFQKLSREWVMLTAKLKNIGITVEGENDA